MLADLEAGRVNAVVVWDLDRLTRRPIEIEEFIDLADRKGVSLASVGGDVDLSTDNGRLFARIKGAVARAEIERKSARQRSANEQRAAAGRPHAGRRCFGYSADGQALRDEEAREVRRAVDAFLRGTAIRRIAMMMNAAGVTTTAGNPWRSTEVRRMLANPRYARVRLHRGEPVGTGDWPAIISMEDHEAVAALLASPERHKAGPPTRHLLSGIARCGTCGARIFGVVERTKGPLYFCETRRHVNRQAAPIDALVIDTILVAISQPEVLAGVARKHNDGEYQSLRTEERHLLRRLEAAADSFAAGEIERSQLARISKGIQEQLEVKRQMLASLMGMPVINDLAASPDILATWETLDLDRRREVIEFFLSIAIHPAGRGSRSFDPNTLQISLKEH